MRRYASSRSKPVLITFSVLAGLQVLCAGASLAEMIGAKTAGFVILVVAAVQAGMTFYVHNEVVPNKNVAARKLPDGRVISGPAADVGGGKPVTLIEGETHVPPRA